MNVKGILNVNKSDDYGMTVVKSRVTESYSVICHFWEAKT